MHSQTYSPLRFVIIATAAWLLLPMKPGKAADTGGQAVRFSGTLVAKRSAIVQVPRVEGPGGNLTLEKLAPNGMSVRQGEVLAEFDRTDQLKQSREAQAKFDDLSHQVDQKRAEQNSNAAKRASDLEGAQADLRKAALEIRKGPILSDIDQEKNRLKLADAEAHTASLTKSNRFHELQEAAELRTLELQRDRQKIMVERQERNAGNLRLLAPMGGMVALQNVFRNQSLGHAQEGDQLWPGSPLMILFDPGKMELVASVNEPDGAMLISGTTAVVHLDAYPQLTFHAHFESASPVASGGYGSPIKTFNAVFVIDENDEHLLPDLSASLDVTLPERKGSH